MQYKAGEPWVSLSYDDSVVDPRGSEPARLQLWPRTKDDASAVALAATMTFRLCPSTPGGAILDAWHVHASPELTSKRVRCCHSSPAAAFSFVPPNPMMRVSDQGSGSGRHNPGERVSAWPGGSPLAAFAGRQWVGAGRPSQRCWKATRWRVASDRVNK